ncbi:MAG: hypothetical protein RSA20_01990, partial [Oscillospiraceae bacterium]
WVVCSTTGDIVYIIKVVVPCNFGVVYSLKGEYNEVVAVVVPCNFGVVYSRGGFLPLFGLL